MTNSPVPPQWASTLWFTSLISLYPRFRECADSLDQHIAYVLRRGPEVRTWLRVPAEIEQIAIECMVDSEPEAAEDHLHIVRDYMSRTFPGQLRVILCDWHNGTIALRIPVEVALSDESAASAIAHDRAQRLLGEASRQAIALCDRGVELSQVLAHVAADETLTVLTIEKAWQKFGPVWEAEGAQGIIREFRELADRNARRGYLKLLIEIAGIGCHGRLVVPMAMRLDTSQGRLS